MAPDVLTDFDYCGPGYVLWSTWPCFGLVPTGLRISGIDVARFPGARALRRLGAEERTHLETRERWGLPAAPGGVVNGEVDTDETSDVVVAVEIGRRVKNWLSTHGKWHDCMR